MFSKIQKIKDDPILGLSKLYAQEKNPNKIDLGVGVFKDEYGRTPIMQAVKTAEKLVLAQQTSKAYLSLLGNKNFIVNIPKLVLGNDSTLFNDGKLAVAQMPAGTGALRIAMQLLKNSLQSKKIWISNPSWSNHSKIAKSVGFEVGTYSYIDSAKNCLDFTNLKADIEKIPNGDILLMHACCHNPTGFDLNAEQWQQIVDILAKKELLIIMDSAYQGLGDSLDKDAQAMRLFAEKLPNLLIATSCSKNFGLYRDRIGALLIKTENPNQTENIQSQIADIVRSIFSSPPDHGAAVVAQILKNEDLYKVWETELTQMRTRIQTLRLNLVNKFRQVDLYDKFEVIQKQKGMFSFTGLTTQQVDKLRNEFAIYMTQNGRINIAGLNNKNIDYFVQSVKKASE